MIIKVKNGEKFESIGNSDENTHNKIDELSNAVSYNTKNISKDQVTMLNNTESYVDSFNGFNASSYSVKRRVDKDLMVLINEVRHSDYIEVGVKDRENHKTVDGITNNMMIEGYTWHNLVLKYQKQYHIFPASLTTAKEVVFVNGKDVLLEFNTQYLISWEVLDPKSSFNDGATGDSYLKLTWSDGSTENIYSIQSTDADKRAIQGCNTAIITTKESPITLSSISYVVNNTKSKYEVRNIMIFKDITLKNYDIPTFFTGMYGVGGPDIKYSDVKKIYYDCGYRSLYLLTNEGKFYYSGLNLSGVSGQGNKQTVPCLTYIYFDEPIKDFNCSSGTSIALETESGKWYMMGDNDYKQSFYAEDDIEFRSRAACMYPRLVNFTENIVKVIAGLNRSIAITSDGTIYYVGSNKNGESGFGVATGTHCTTPTAWKFNYNDVLDLYINNEYNSIVLLKNGELWVSGYNKYGLCGIDPATTGNYVTEFTLVGTYVGAKKLFQKNRGTTFILMEDGSCLSYGDNKYCQAGHPVEDNTYSRGLIKPTKIASIKEKVIEVLQENEYTDLTGFLCEGGVYYLTGYNEYNEMGIEDYETNCENSYSLAPVKYTELYGEKILDMKVGYKNVRIKTTTGWYFSGFSNGNAAFYNNMIGINLKSNKYYEHYFTGKFVKVPKEIDDIYSLEYYHSVVSDKDKIRIYGDSSHLDKGAITLFKKVIGLPLTNNLQITSCNKNLFSIHSTFKDYLFRASVIIPGSIETTYSSKTPTTYDNNVLKWTAPISQENISYGYLFDVKPGTKYTLSYKTSNTHDESDIVCTSTTSSIRVIGTNAQMYVKDVYVSEDNLAVEGSHSYTFTTSPYYNKVFIAIYGTEQIYSKDAELFETDDVDYVSNTRPKVFEKTIALDSPLYSIGTMRDFAYNDLVRKTISEFKMDGREDTWYKEISDVNNPEINTLIFYNSGMANYHTDFTILNNYLLGEKFFVRQSGEFFSTDSEAITIDDYLTFYVRIEKEKLNLEDRVYTDEELVVEFKKYLNKNNLRILSAGISNRTVSLLEQDTNLPTFEGSTYISSNAYSVNKNLIHCELPIINEAKLPVIKGNGVPTNPPKSIGQMYMDLTNKKQYLAFGTDTAEDWVIQGVQEGPILWTGTQEEYDSISVKDENTLYFIK